MRVPLVCSLRPPTGLDVDDSAFVPVPSPLPSNWPVWAKDCGRSRRNANLSRRDRMSARGAFGVGPFFRSVGYPLVPALQERPMRKCLPLATVVLAWTTPVAAFDTPIRKPGLWEIRTTAEGQTRIGQFCGDAESHKLFDWIDANPQDPRCSEPKRQMVGGAMVIESTCKIGDMTTTSRKVMTGDFTSDYTVNITDKSEATGILRG